MNRTLRLAALLLWCAAAPLRAQGLRLVMLGTGTPNPEPDRSGPALAVIAGGTAYLVDAGAGVVRRAQAAAEQRGIAALGAAHLRIVFLTHLHSDHTLGLPDLILTPWVLGRAIPLTVYGPPGTAAMVAHLEAAYAVDVRRRQDGWQPENATGWRAIAHEIRPGPVYADSNVRVTAFHVLHGDWPDAFGYRFESGREVIVVSGDTRATDAVADACDGCDILVHEAYSDSGFATLPADWQRYHRHFHTSAADLARVATRAHPKLLVLTHTLTWGGVPRTTIVDELRRAGYTGRVVLANDLDVFP